MFNNVSQKIYLVEALWANADGRAITFADRTNWVGVALVSCASLRAGLSDEGALVVFARGIKP